MKLMGALSSLAVANVMAHSCVKLTATNLDSCPCDAATLTFTLERVATIAENPINLALVLDGSKSVQEANFGMQTDFAVDVVETFDKNVRVFNSEGKAYYVQYATSVTSAGPFGSASDFKTHADEAVYLNGASTATALGISAARQLLIKNSAAALIMIVITDGQSNEGGRPGPEADLARLAGIDVFAVGVGPDVDETELKAIGGSKGNYVIVDNFAGLDVAVERIVSMIEDTLMLCDPEYAMLTINFSVPVGYTAPGSISESTITFAGSTVTYCATDLSSVSTDFDIILDVCDVAPGDRVGVWTEYFDSDGNFPDLFPLDSLVVREDFCEPATEPPQNPPYKPLQQTPPGTSQRHPATLGEANFVPWLLLRNTLKELTQWTHTRVAGHDRAGAATGQASTSNDTITCNGNKAAAV